MVVMEQGSRWPAWVDDQNGPDSSVWVLAQRRGEVYDRFAPRALERIRTIMRSSSARQAVFVCNAEGGAEAMASRRTLLQALLYELSVAGGGQTVVAVDGAAVHRRELCRVVAGLVDELDADEKLSIRIRALPSEPPRSLRAVA